MCVFPSTCSIESIPIGRMARLLQGEATIMSMSSIGLLEIMLEKVI